MSRAEKLRRVRAQALLVRRLSEQRRAQAADGMRAVRLDGMPHSRGNAGLDVQIEKREALAQLLSQESARLREYDRQARGEMDRMKPEHYAFCALYYLAGISIEETAEAIDRSVRQCMRYKREIEEEG